MCPLRAFSHARELLSRPRVDNNRGTLRNDLLDIVSFHGGKATRSNSEGSLGDRRGITSGNEWQTEAQPPARASGRPSGTSTC
jgi:hypothetical protein